MALLKRKDDVRRGLIAPSLRSQPRPTPDEAPLEADGEQPMPQPERAEAKLRDPGLMDLSFADYKAIVIRAFKEFLDDNAMMLASALAYSAFFAIPSTLVVAVGLFTLVASPADITNFLQSLHGVVPQNAVELIGQSLRRTDQNAAGSLVMTIIGFVLAVWSVTGAMNSYMTALNMTYERKDRRSFVRKRVVALKMAGVLGFAFALVAVLTLFGPVVENWLAGKIGPAGAVLDIAWWIAQWPILLVGLLVAFATLLYLGPDVDHPKWEFMTPGSLIAALLWIVASGAFAIYTATFSSYDKTWGPFSAVIVMLTWLWITAMALLLGAEINAEAERSRKLRKA
jgi:membrane protein